MSVSGGKTPRAITLPLNPGSLLSLVDLSGIVNCINSNYSVGLRIHCADRKKLRLEGKNPIGTADLEWILRVTVRVLNSYGIH